MVRTTFEVINNYKDDPSEMVEVAVECEEEPTEGCVAIEAFGELAIYIHLSLGHYIHWHVVIIGVDCAIKSQSSAKLSRETTMQGALDAITKLGGYDDLEECGTWWLNAQPELKKILNWEEYEELYKEMNGKEKI